MRLCVYWNPRAGGGNSLDDLIATLRRAGHTVVHTAEQASELASHLPDVDCVVAAGGDGAVARAARALAGQALPLAILPRGTANNIAISLRVSGDVATAAGRWHAARTVAVDVGVVSSEDPPAIFAESVGCGLATDCIDIGSQTLSKDDADVHLEKARSLYLDVLENLAPRQYDITLDGETLSGEFLLVEALNTATIGPQLELSQAVNIADGWLSVVTVAANERDVLRDYLAALRSGEAPPPAFKAWPAKTVEIRGDDRMHVDDRVTGTGGKPIRIAVRPAALNVLA